VSKFEPRKSLVYLFHFLILLLLRGFAESQISELTLDPTWLACTLRSLWQGVTVDAMLQRPSASPGMPVQQRIGAA
jgi:hypothetical protein